MADPPPEPAARFDATEAGRLTLSQVWQVPVLLAGIVMLTVGGYLVMPRHESPQYGEMLDTARQYLEADNLEEAKTRLDLLAERGVTDPERADAALRARYHRLLGDFQFLDYRRLYELPVQTPQSRELLERAVAGYGQARDLGGMPAGDSLRWWAEALVLLGRDGEALTLVNDMDAATPGDRYTVLRQLIDRHRTQKKADAEGLNRLLGRFEDELRADPDAARRLDQRQWLAHLRATVYLDVDDPQRAIDYINREMQRLRALGAADSPRLLTLLARAYQRVGDLDAARRLYAAAQQRLEEGDPLNGTILVGLGQVELAAGGEADAVEPSAESGPFRDRALALFTRAAKEYPLTDAYIDALIGRAHVEALGWQVADALDHFRLAVAQALEQTHDGDPRRADLTDKVSAHVDRAMQAERFDDALDFLGVLKPMYADGDTLPPRLLLQFAQLHEKVAQQRLARGDALDPAAYAGEGEPSAGARRQAYQESALHFAESAEFFRRHAQTVTIIDPAAHGRSLWAAGENFDHAQQWPRAIGVYAEFVATRPSDGDQLRARHALARAYMADRQYQTAIDLFNGLIDENPQSNWAYRSLVPLARSYTAVDQTDAAVRTLLGVVDGHPGITPESETYREALIDLARTYYLLGQEDPVYFVSAIERLTVAVERYGLSAEGPVLRYMLADSLRRSTDALDRQAADARSQRQRAAFETERDKRLRDAEMYYDQVLTELDAKPAAARSKLENLYLRNAYFYKADCAFIREAYEVAVDRYREAARRYAEHPASLVAQVQIVNAFCELGQFQQAFVANQNALWQLAQMPDEAFDSPDMPMTRQHWEDWLRWSSELELLDPDTQSAAVEP